MKNFIILSSLSILLSSCAIFLTEDSPELLNEKSCKETCLIKNKTYLSFDEDFGCYCAEKE